MTMFPLSIIDGRPMAGLSSRYSFVPTRPLLDAALDSGFTVSRVQAMRPRSRDPHSVRHMVRLRPSNATPINGVFPELVIVNSHDGSSRLRLLAGLFRLICGNGLIVADAVFAPPMVLRHVDVAADQPAALLRAGMEATQRVVERLPRYQGTLLTEAASLAYAERAAALSTSPVIPSQLLRPRRIDDAQNDLWSIYNRVQENLLRGGVATSRRTRSRRITSVGRDLAINTALWALTNEFLEEHV